MPPSHSRTSVADDCVEEHKLLGQKLARVQELDSNEVGVETGGNSEEIIAHLRECIKTERDQKVIICTYFIIEHTQVGMAQIVHNNFIMCNTIQTRY